MFIDSLTLHSSDLQAQFEFYVTTLGFTVNRKSDDELSITVGRTKLIFIKKEEQPAYHYCFLVPSNQLEEALAWAQERMELIETEEGFLVETNSLWQAHSFYFLDGNGNIAEFIAHYNLENTSDDSFSAESVLAVNEIGCPSGDIATLNAWLEKTTGSKFWTGNTERFGTNGSEEGCFLLVDNTVKDTWYPTQLFPESAPFRIRMRQGDSSFHLQYSSAGFTLL